MSNLNIKVFLCVWIKKTRYPVSKEFSTFLYMRICRVWAHWNHSFHVHLSYLGHSDLCFSYPEFQWELISLVQGCSVKFYLNSVSMCVSSCVWLLVTLWAAEGQAFMSFTVSPSSFKLESLSRWTTSCSAVPFFLLPSMLPSIKIFFNE